MLTTPATATATAKSLQSCPTLCDPIDSSPPASPVPEILQARTLEWVAISSPRGSSQASDRTWVSYISYIAGGFFTTMPKWISTWKRMRLDHCLIPLTKICLLSNNKRLKYKSWNCKMPQKLHTQKLLTLVLTIIFWIWHQKKGQQKQV